MLFIQTFMMIYDSGGGGDFLFSHDFRTGQQSGYGALGVSLT